MSPQPTPSSKRALARALAVKNLLMDPTFPFLKSRIINFTGLAYYRDKNEELAGKIADRLQMLGLPKGSDYLKLIQKGKAAEAELEVLVADLTIGETYFFRYPEQFDALRQVILPDILEKNKPRRQIRIWSAGCGVGAEPYSVSLMLKREFASELKDWDVTILGTDINQNFLVQAREAKFRDWALRGLSAEIKNSCFLRAGKLWQLKDCYKEGVTFQYHNLVKNPFPSLVHNINAFDIIFCRNVLIYFSLKLVRDCLNRFKDSLMEGGWFLTGDAEINPDIPKAFQRVNTLGTTLLKRPEKDKKEEAPKPKRVLPQDAMIPKIFKSTNQADWPLAIGLCEELINREERKPLGHFYRAIVLEQMGRVQEAANAINRAIDLDWNFVLAHYHKGLLMQKENNIVGASRSFQNALTLLKGMEPDRVFAEAGGMAVSDLTDLIQMQLGVLDV